MAKPKPTGTAIVNIEAELAKEAAEISKRISAPGGDFIKCTKDKQFKLPDGTKQPGPMRVVILDFVSGNFFYDRPWVDGEITPPACFALGTEPNNLIPSASSPVKEAEDCKDCPNNVFGSKGRGKACSNNRILALTTPDGDEDAPVWLLKVSPTALKAFDAYVASIKMQFNTTPIGVETDIYFDPGVDHQSLRFGNPSPNKNLAVHFNRKSAARDRLLTPPDVSQYEPVKQKKAAGKR